MTTLKIEGMTCGHCQKAVKAALEGVVGVVAVEVDLANGSATVSGEVNTDTLIAAVVEEGYQANLTS